MARSQMLFCYVSSSDSYNFCLGSVPLSKIYCYLNLQFKLLAALRLHLPLKAPAED